MVEKKETKKAKTVGTAGKATPAKTAKTAAPAKKAKTVETAEKAVPKTAPVKKTTPKKSAGSTVRKTVRKRSAEEALVRKIAECMLEKKGENVVSLDLRNAIGSTFDYFVICEAMSGQQVRTIADEISDKVYADLSEDALHTEGYANGEWILLDYGHVLAHVFLREMRQHYRLEELWGDAVLEIFKDED